MKKRYSCLLIALFGLLVAVFLSACTEENAGSGTAVSESLSPSEEASHDEDGKKEDTQEVFPESAGSEDPAAPEEQTDRKIIACHESTEKIAGVLSGAGVFENTPVIVKETYQDAFQALMAGECDILISSEIGEMMKYEARMQKISLLYEPVAADALVFFVHKDNPVSSLTQVQLYDILTGQVTDWAEVGGTPGKIRLYGHPENSPAENALRKVLLTEEEIVQEKHDITGGSEEIPGVISSFAAGEGAIGYACRKDAEVLYLGENVKLLSVDGIAPDQDAVRLGIYPLCIYDYCIQKRFDEDPEALSAKEWLISQEGQEKLSEAGFLPLDLSVPVPEKEARVSVPEKTLDLDSFYETNGAVLLPSETVLDGEAVRFFVLSGMKDDLTEEKIVQELMHDQQEAWLSVKEQYPGRLLDMTCRVTASFSNVFSASFEIVDKDDPENGPLLTVYENFDLSTGERLTLPDLFRKNAGAADLFTAPAFDHLAAALSEQENVSGESWVRPITDYRDTEDRLLHYASLYEEGEELSFWFDPRKVVILSPDGDALPLFFADIAPQVVLYDRYRTENSVYDQTQETLSGIPVCTVRPDAEKQVISLTEDRYVDATLVSNLKEDAFGEEEMQAVLAGAEKQFLQLVEAESNGLFTDELPGILNMTVRLYEENGSGTVRAEVNVMTLKPEDQAAFDTMVRRILEFKRSRYNGNAAASLFLYAFETYDEDMHRTSGIERKTAVFFLDRQGNVIE